MLTMPSHHRTEKQYLSGQSWLTLVGVVLVVWFVIGCTAYAAELNSGESYIESGKQYYDRGHFDQAAVEWENAARVFESEARPKEQAQALLYFSQALHNLGHYQRARMILELARTLVSQNQDDPMLARILGRLGNVALSLGHKKEAEDYLTKGLALARKLTDSGITAAILNDRGNFLASERRYGEALGAFTEATVLADAIEHHSLAVTALINAAWSSLLEGRFEETKDRLDLAFTQVNVLAKSHEKAREILSIGLAYHRLRQTLQPSNVKLIEQSAKAFQTSADIASELNDHRTASYGWGYLGHLYEEEGRLPEAIELTRRAILAAQQARAQESLYKWEWQIGRLLRAQGKYDDAKLAYRRAVYTLQPIRHEVAQEFPVQTESFRASIGPLFFELIDLLLTQSETVANTERYQTLLVEARQSMEQFKTAELQDYFQDNCVETVLAKQANVDQIVQGLEHTAVIYPIQLPDRLELLVSVHNRGKAELQRERVSVSSDILSKEVRVFRRLLEKRTTQEYLPHAQQIYAWLIEPIQHYLQDFEIDTIVFVPDGSLRTIPLGALHDGNSFLIEQYALAITPGIVLTDPRPINRENLKLLSVGLTDSVQGFPSLPNVASEIRILTEMYGGRVLLNKEFLVEELAQEMKVQHPTIVHIASHAKFEREAKNTFLLAFDGKLTMDRLDELIGLYQFRETPLDLLTLSACETAAGDDRAALGLAGVAVKAGARSALATLWFINDQATSKLVTEFYRVLHEDISLSKAKALQKAKTILLQHPTYQHPSYWSPFLLINNWL